MDVWLHATLATLLFDNRLLRPLLSIIIKFSKIQIYIKYIKVTVNIYVYTSCTVSIK